MRLCIAYSLRTDRKKILILIFDMNIYIDKYMVRTNFSGLFVEAEMRSLVIFGPKGKLAFSKIK